MKENRIIPIRTFAVNIRGFISFGAFNKLKLSRRYAAV